MCKIATEQDLTKIAIAGLDRDIEAIKEQLKYEINVSEIGRLRRQLIEKEQRKSHLQRQLKNGK